MLNCAEDERAVVTALTASRHKQMLKGDLPTLDTTNNFLLFIRLNLLIN
jgi:hypothetical protein